MKNILFIVAHPDDFANGMGGTAHLLKDIYNLHVVCMTKGERGVPGKSIGETAAVREKEESKACSLVNARLTFMGKIDREVYADLPTCEQVAEIVKKLEPLAIFTIWPVDSHPDHSAVSEIAKKAAFLAEIPMEIIYCEEGTEQTSHFTPDIYVDISKVVDEKLKMMRCHQSQNPDDKMAQAFLSKTIIRGKEAWCPNAEGFKVLSYLKDGSESILSGISVSAK